MLFLTPRKTRKRRHFAMCYNNPGEAIDPDNTSNTAGGANLPPATSQEPNSSVSTPPADAEVLPKYSSDSNDLPISELLEKYPELKDSTSLTKYKTVKELLEGHQNLDSKIGTMISLPKEDASEEEKALAYDKIYKKLGKPENIDGYELSKEVPDGTILNEELQVNFAKTALDLHLTKDQAQKLQAFHNASMKSILDSYNKNAEIEAETNVSTQIASLKETWGAEYKTKTQIAMNTAKSLLSKETLEYLDKTGLGNNSKFIQDFYNISKKFESDTLPIKPETFNTETELATLEADALKLRKDPDLSRSPEKLKKLKELSTRIGEIKFGN